MPPLLLLMNRLIVQNSVVTFLLILAVCRDVETFWLVRREATFHVALQYR